MVAPALDAYTFAAVIRPSSMRFACAAFALVAQRAEACPCNLVAGPSAPLTLPSERWGFSAGLSLLHELGSYSERGAATPDPTGVRSDRATLDLGAAFRPVPRLELGLSTSASATAIDLPGVTIRERAMGDVLARGRYDLRTLTDAGPWPSLALTGAVRLPTGTSSASGTSASFAPGIGLGAWEIALGVDLRRNVGERFQVDLAGEGAVRVSDGSAEGDRVPGPRFTASAAGLYLPSSRVAFAATARLWWEGAVRVNGQSLAGSSLYRTTVSLAATVRLSDTLRCTAGASLDPLAEGFGRNTVSTLSGALTLAWSR